MAQLLSLRLGIALGGVLPGSMKPDAKIGLHALRFSGVRERPHSMCSPPSFRDTRWAKRNNQQLRRSALDDRRRCRVTTSSLREAPSAFGSNPLDFALALWVG
jgi:hypothetical protein